MGDRNITDDMIVTFDAAYMVCAETHVGGDGDTSERCCIASGIERVAPLIAAQALRSVDVDRIAQAIGDPGSIVGRKLGPSWGLGNDGYAEQEETVTRWSTRAVLAALGQTP